MPSFGKTSAARLDSLCPELRDVCTAAIRVMDFSVIETYRDRETQERYLSQGVTTLPWPQSKHNRNPSDAVDLWPYVSQYKMALNGHPDQVTELAMRSGKSRAEVEAYIRTAFGKLAGVMFACAESQGVAIRWGGDWDGDGSSLDQTFHDLPHFEVVR